ncbi:MAG: glycosyl-4,4'-diaponeurosporenoate acyltransferase [Oscillospiraceae bacterium]
MKFLYSLIYIAVLGVLSHFVGQALPRKWFDAEKPPYKAAGWEKGGKVYEKLGIKRWKDIVPDMSRIMPDMVKKKLTSENKERGMDTLIAETCVAECVHWGLIVLSFGILFWWRGLWAAVFLLVYNILGNLPFIIIQRYNRPRLVMLEQRRKRRAVKA